MALGMTRIFTATVLLLASGAARAIPFPPAALLSLCAVCDDDGRLDGRDIQAFVSCLITGGPDCNCWDLNDNAMLDTGDIALLVATLLGDAPFAVADYFTTAEDTQRNANVLTNDLDPNGPGTTAASPIGPSHGMLNLAANGAMIYSPALNYSGPDSFSYRAVNGLGMSGPATVHLMVTPVADAPTLQVANAQGQQDMAIPLSISASLVDTDGSEVLSLLISGVPLGAQLSAGMNQGGGTWRLLPGQLAGLRVTPPAGSTAGFTLTVIATATETANGDQATTTRQLSVNIACPSGFMNCDGNAANGCETNINTSLAHCGSCNTPCVLANATEACINGICTITACNTGFGNCDGNQANGCERNLRTLTDCGNCNVACLLANASASCSTGQCMISTCNAGYSNCDGNHANGCEVDHIHPTNTCGNAEYVGSACADLTNGTFCTNSTNWQAFAVRSGRASRWFRSRANECSACCSDLQARVTLQVPAGIDFDLYAYNNACGPVIASSVNGTGATDQILLQRNDNCFSSDESFDYWIEVRFYGGASCSNWTLTFEGRN